MPVTVSCPFPVFVSVTTCGALVLPTDCDAKVRLVVLKLAADATPVPLKLTV